MRIPKVFNLPRRLWITRQFEPGAMPGRIVIDPAAQKPRVVLTKYDNDRVETREIHSPDEIAAITVEEGKVTWLEIDGLGDEQILRAIQKAFGLHRLAMEDVVNLHQRPKVEDYRNYLYIVMNQVAYEEKFEKQQISIFSGKGFVITFDEKPDNLLRPVHDRIDKNLGIIRQNGADYLAYAIIDAIIDSYFPVLEAVGTDVEELELQILSNVKRNPVQILHELKQGLIMIRRATWPMRDAINSLLRDYTDRFAPETQIHLRDCYDHAVRLIDHIETYRELTSDLMDLHLNNIGLRTNEIMKVITIIGAIFIPLNFLAALYGMNFDPDTSPYNMPETRAYYAYPIVLLVMAIIAAGMVVFFRFKRWIGNDD